MNLSGNKLPRLGKGMRVASSILGFMMVASLSINVICTFSECTGPEPLHVVWNNNTLHHVSPPFKNATKAKIGMNPVEITAVKTLITPQVYPNVFSFYFTGHYRTMDQLLNSQIGIMDSMVNRTFE